MFVLPPLFGFQNFNVCFQAMIKEEAMKHLSTMGAIAQAMYMNNYWDRPQYSILREMYNDLQKMINKYWVLI